MILFFMWSFMQHDCLYRHVACFHIKGGGDDIALVIATSCHHISQSNLFNTLSGHMMLIWTLVVQL